VVKMGNDYTATGFHGTPARAIRFKWCFKPENLLARVHTTGVEKDNMSARPIFQQR